MADVISPGSKLAPNPLFLRDEELRQGIELLFYAYRDFTGEPDAILARIGLGRAHHRAIYFVGRHAGITVSDLLDILKITKQSLSRVLSQVIREGYVQQRPGKRDRRQRLLYATEKCRRFFDVLSATQTSRIDAASDALQPDGKRTVLKFFVGMVEPRDRPTLDRLKLTEDI
ncbi:MAG: MarR family transcriptional regulator [Sphingopyxis terrae]|nr:MAG: MarR family transcriptional regulator [Sphingopyxis terrae]